MVRASRARPARRRSSSSIASGGVTPVKAAITAGIVGMIEKSGVLDNLPEIPVVGRKGTIAIVAWYWSRHGGGHIARDVALVTAAICGYQYGREGKIDG
jgi:hypothetical protein